MAGTKPQGGPVAVVIVTYQGRVWIERCIDSLLGGDSRPHVIVVDNASDDGTADLIRRRFPQVEVLAQTRNRGFGVGNNVGIRSALDQGFEYIFLLNQDAYVVGDAIDRLVAFMGEHPEVAASSPLHCSPDADHIDSKTFRGYLQRYAQEYLCDAALGHARVAYSVHGINAAAWFVRASTFIKGGGFDPLFFMYGEDDDLLARWAHLGLRFTLLTNCRIVHLRQSPSRPEPSFVEDIRRRSERRRSELLGAIKHPAYSLRHMVSVWLAHGMVEPVVHCLVRRSARELLASWHAAARVLLEFKTIRRHGRVTARTGAHFL